MREKDGYRKLMTFSGKAASVFVIGGLVFTIGVMYKKGQLDNLTSDMKEVVAGIMNRNETSELDNVVLLDEKKNNITKGQEEDEKTSAEEPTTVPEEPTTPEEVTEAETEAESVSQETSAESTTEETAAIVPAATQYYEVQKGDTLYGICKKLYGNTNNIKVIMELNNLDSADSITYGKTLIVP